MYGNDQKARAISGGFGEAYRPEPATQLPPMPLRDREPDVGRALNELERNVIDLSDRLSVLEARLGPVMSAPPTSPGAGVGLAPACELSGVLRTMSDRVSDQAARVADILSRLEV